MDLYEKKYKEVQKWIESIYQDLSHEQQMEAEAHFPELVESDNDRIRKELISFLQSYDTLLTRKFIVWLEKQGEKKVSVVDFNAKDWYVSKVDGKIYNAKFMEKKPTNIARKLEIEKAAMSATGILEQEEWFIKGAEWSDKNPFYVSSEKQDEQNLVDKEVPKFHEGDWVILTAGELSTTLQIVNVDTNKKLYWFNDSTYLPIVDEECLHHWTIQDAKDGDVLFYDDGWTCIFKNIHGIWYSSYCFITADGEFNKGYERHAIDAKINGHVHPATKEQRETLTKAMTDAGYTFDFEKKELKKVEQKPAWSEEDECYMSECIGAIATKDGWSFEEKIKTKHWLESIKQRIGG